MIRPSTRAAAPSGRLKRKDERAFSIKGRAALAPESGSVFWTCVQRARAAMGRGRAPQ